MNRFEAYFTMESSWYKEVWLCPVFPQGSRYACYNLTKEEKEFLSEFRDKESVQEALENKGINLYRELVRNKDAARILRNTK